MQAMQEKNPVLNFFMCFFMVEKKTLGILHLIFLYFYLWDQKGLGHFQHLVNKNMLIVYQKKSIFQSILSVYILNLILLEIQ